MQASKKTAMDSRKLQRTAKDQKGLQRREKGIVRDCKGLQKTTMDFNRCNNSLGMNETVVKEHFCRNGKQQQKHFAEGCACTGAALKLLYQFSWNPFMISTFFGTDMFMNISNQMPG